MYIIIGLGNPGKEYENTRHNIGFMVVEEVAQRIGILELKVKSKQLAFMGEGVVEGHKVILAEPNTYMNNSGIAAAAILNWHKIDSKHLTDHLIVIHDDVDLLPGDVRIKQGGGAGGHHGIESVIAHTGGANFVRIRVGIGRETITGDVSNYVLGNINEAERKVLAPAIVRAADAALAIVTHGLPSAMNRFNA